MKTQDLYNKFEKARRCKSLRGNTANQVEKSFKFNKNQSFILLNNLRFENCKKPRVERAKRQINRCLKTGRIGSYFKQFNLGRHSTKQLARHGKLINFKNTGW